MIDLDELRKLAEAATPGPWEMSIDLDDSVNIYHDSEVRMWIADTGQAHVAGDVSTAEFIAAANPATVLELIERHRNVEEGVKQFMRALDAMTAERDAALARIAEAAKLHRKAHVVFSWATGGVRYEDPCPDCDGKAGVHDCGCWADVDIEYHCAECDGSRERASWPCPTAVALGLNEGENENE